ncbi:polyhomeotic-like protein 2 isoform X2 [Paramacrobiotus metropolitanus]|uniref:polyhomeotic-like protein 2 isoform X2 n=1 Tax=Paramacrobiotus metropolitanus TaxID=2943436 RepID=UPI0024458D76|nr:polyhomeotic-like protein 2 isoform X2 [Paramacrobiotus metropolitanus]
MPVGKQNAAAVTHVIGGRRIEEASGEGPSGDPLDRDDNSSSSSRPPDASKLRKSASAISATKSASPQKAVQTKKDAPRSTEVAKKKTQVRKRIPKNNSARAKRTAAEVGSESETDSDGVKEKNTKKKVKPTFARKQGTHADSSSDADFSEFSEVTEPPSETTSGGEDLERKSEEGGPSTSGKPCEYCGRKFTFVNRPGASDRFCSKSCSRQYDGGFTSRIKPVKRNPTKTPASPKKKLGRPFGSKSKKTKPSAAREKESRPGNVPFKKGPTTSKHKTPPETEKPAKKEENSPAKSQPSERDSPEIHAPPPSSSNNSSIATTPSPTKSPEKLDVDEAKENPTGRRSTKRAKSAIGHLSPKYRSYVNDRPDNVKILMTEKPLVSWDYSDVAAYIGSVPGLENLAIVMLTEQIDGQCLCLFDDNTWRKGFNVKMGPSLKLRKAIDMLKDLQKDEALKAWHEERPALFSAAVAHLEGLPALG